ncbi:MAG: choloylglycine hydrolase [Oscillospiraceae bacterium]|nr:choloylglycine hydrolase [Oscillospiraceae bacterium]MBR2890665.1 choloylglycine hydrolase [Oscillospiraceae bacterium]
MCTAITYRTRDFYFGRTLDLEFSYNAEVTVTPRNFPLPFRHSQTLERHYAFIGMARTEDGYPLYFDGCNEKGLCMAGLDFTGSAHYGCGSGDRKICHFELIPWILGQCANLREVRSKLEQLHLMGDAFREDIPPARLHWLIADRDQALTLEATREGIRWHENPAGVLTNNPPFEQMLFSLNQYLHLTPEEPENRFARQLRLEPFTHGLGAMGLPGDLSSPSRFVRAAFTKLNAVSGETESESVGQFFHILDTVSQTRGCSRTEDGDCEITVYTCCCNADRGIYYYTTYENRQITAVSMEKEDPEGRELIRYPRMEQQQILYQN